MVDLKIKLPDHFLDEEVRCDFTVTRKMKELWAVELDLLAELDRVCKKYDLKYSATGGTMLGVIRHKGFIPWDDDIDVMMLRDDYERLCNIAMQEFKFPYFFQTEYTDPGSLRRHAQLRNSQTTAIREVEEKWHYPFNQGIFIDIFPVDAVIDDQDLFEKQKAEAMALRHTYMEKAKWNVRYHEGPNKAKNVLKGVVKGLNNSIFAKKYDYLSDYRAFEKVCARYNSENTKYLSLLSFQFDNPKHYKTREGWKQIEYMDFEFMKMPVTSDYDEILTIQYGDYMKMQKVNTIHGGLIVDTNQSYQDYFKNRSEK